MSPYPGDEQLVRHVLDPDRGLASAAGWPADDWVGHGIERSPHSSCMPRTNPRLALSSARVAEPEIA